MSSPSDPSAYLHDPTLRAILEAAGDWLWDADLVNDITIYQEGFWEQYGYAAPQVSETFDMVRVVHFSDLGELTRAWRAHLDGETDIYRSEWRMRTAAGDWRWIKSQGKVIERDPDGRPLRMVGAYTDITEIKGSELRLSESNAELDAIFKSSRDGLAVIAPDLKVLKVNAAAAAIFDRYFGARIAEAMSILEIPSLNPERPVIRDIELTLAGNFSVPSRLAVLRDHGAYLEFSYFPVLDEAQRILGAAVTIRDVTEKTRLEQSRLQTLRLESMGLMAGGIAHDFNNLLGAILGNIELAQMAVADEEAKAGLEDARDAARRASELVQQLLAFAGHHEPIVRPVDVSVLAREIVRYARKIPGARVAIVESLPAGLPEIDADATALRQLVLNLIVNAVDATREKGSAINVRAWTVVDPREVSDEFLIVERPASRYIALQVTDDGSGIDADTRARIFDPFFTTKETGHGLGLASVLGTVRSHGGTLSVESQPGAGATFTVFLPAN